MDGLLTSAEGAIQEVKNSQSSFDAVIAQPLGSNAFTNSLAALTTIASKFDETSSSYQVTNPLTGAGGFILDLRRGWKSYTVASAASYPIYAQHLLYKTGVYNSMKDLSAAAVKAKDSTSLNKATSSLNDVRTFKTQVTDFKNKIYDYGGQGDGVIAAAQIGFSVYYAVVMGCAIAMVVGIGLFVLCGCAKCRCISHLGWCLLAFFMIIGFLFGTLFFPISVVLVEACDLIKLSNLKEDRGIIPSSAWNEIGVCLSGDGDLYKKYELNTKIDFASQINTAFSLVTTLYDATANSLRYNISDAFVAQVLLQSTCRPSRSATLPQTKPPPLFSTRPISSAKPMAIARATRSSGPARSVVPRQSSPQPATPMEAVSRSRA